MTGVKYKGEVFIFIIIFFVFFFFLFRKKNNIGIADDIIKQEVNSSSRVCDYRM